MALNRLATICGSRRKTTGECIEDDFDDPKLVVAKEEYMIDNGAMLLEKQMSYGYGKGSNTSYPFRIFSFDEIKKATNNLDDRLIFDRAFLAVKYKGTLEDGCIVGIDFWRFPTSPPKWFVDLILNEVAVNHIICHKNVIKLHGCCLETRLPILVYEFLPIFTLFDHIHGRDLGDNIIPSFNVPWSESLRIAADISHALSYMHLSLPKPIVHMCIWSRSIYLDEYFNAKLGNFRYSVAITPGEDFIVELDWYLLGYVNPEYVATHRVTEKCDVYSFGILLVELLTGKNTLTIKDQEGRSFVEYFDECFKQVDGVSGIVHPRVLTEAAVEEIHEFAGLALRCVASRGEDRPTMREVAIELRRMHLAAKQKAKMP